MSNVALIIIYNHQYNKNIDVLERLYKDRFEYIYHLVPFYRGEKKNVIPVYENSHFFQGYVAQGLSSYFNDSYDHYFFIGDDLIINPVINQHNYQEHLKLNSTSSYIPRLDSLHNKWKKYNIKSERAASFSIDQDGLEVKDQLPDYDTALHALRKFGIDIAPLEYEQVALPPSSSLSNLNYHWKRLKNKKKPYHLDYPLTSSYSDIFVVDAKSIKDFCHYCGVFAATRLWVEVGLPTALALSAQKIITQDDLALKGRALWTEDDHKILDKYAYSLDKLMTDFPDTYLYLHPVKLSKWKMD